MCSSLQLAELSARVRKLGSTLMLPELVQGAAADMALQLAPTFFSTRRISGTLLATTCLFVQGRLNQLPITLVRVALAAQVCATL